MNKEVKSEIEMISLGKTIGSLLGGGEIIELIGDVGSGKTTLTKGIAKGLGIDEHIQSPSFTINRIYNGRNDITLAHYDFYRLDDAGIMANELKEVTIEPKTVTVIEWAGLVSDCLPKDRLSIVLTSPTENLRKITINSGGSVSERIMSQIKW